MVYGVHGVKPLVCGVHQSLLDLVRPGPLLSQSIEFQVLASRRLRGGESELAVPGTPHELGERALEGQECERTSPVDSLIRPTGVPCGLPVDVSDPTD